MVSSMIVCLMKAFELAYSDIRAAFWEFMERNRREAVDGKRRPFILASHSQGGHHLIRLLEEEVEPVHPEHGDIFSNCVCVYIIGSKLPVDKLDPTIGLRRFQMSRHPRDTHCLIAWDACTRARSVVTHPEVRFAVC